MRIHFFSLVTASSLALGSLLLSAQPDTQQPTADQSSLLLPWTTDYEQAMNVAKTSSLPVYLYFTGSTWCIWCKKMEDEIHNQDAFRQKMVGKFIFVKIDLPVGGQSSETTKKLLQQYNIQGVPSIIILSPQGTELGRFRYQRISPDQYADLVSSCVHS